MADNNRSSSERISAEHERLVTFLNNGAGGPIPADKLIETHAAQIFLIGERAYKIKKPVNLGYLDFSTLQKRQWALARELERNHRSAPEIYLKLATIRRGPEGKLHLDGEGELVDHVLVMRRFPDDALLSNNVEMVSGDFAENLGRLIAHFHAEAPIVQTTWPNGLKYSVDSNADQLLKFQALWGAGEVQALITNTKNAFVSFSDEIQKRTSGGFVRQCHGDLHLRNIFVSAGKPVLFDCIEFDDRLSDIDVLYDLAFLVMDLLHAGQAEGANRVVNGYIDQAQRSFSEDFLSGLALLPLFLSMRAGVRAHVSAQMDRLKDGRLYLNEALSYLQKSEPSLMSVGGFSGTGKTTFAHSRAPSIGSAPGAIVLRSDEIRKRLWGVAPLERLPQAAYAKDESTRVYETMFEEARQILRAGCAVILDAVFLLPGERDRCRCLAKEERVDFQGYWLEAPIPALRARLTARRDDASDADLAVLEHQLECDPGEIDWQMVDATKHA